MSSLMTMISSNLLDHGCNVPDLASLGNIANVCVGSKVYSI
jgi:hypothetical protein